MGLSLSSYSGTVSTVKVISLNGVLREFPAPIKVEHVLKFEIPACFVSHPDSMYFNDYIPALNSDVELQMGQIYFVLPMCCLQYPLQASDMATLAMKASSALIKASKKRGRGKKISVSPFVDFSNQQLVDDGFEKYEKVNLGLARSGSVMKLQRKASTRAKLANRLVKTRLNTVYEGSSTE